MKYRIVSRNRHLNGDCCSYEYYYAQVNVFGIWIDCHLNPFISTYNSFDTELKVVEEWVQSRIKQKEPVQQEVVKTYD